MKVLLDVRLAWHTDLTHVFMLSLAKSLEKRGAEIYITPNSRSPILNFEVLSEPDAPETLQSDEPGSLVRVADVCRVNESLKVWGYQAADAQSQISRQISLLKNHKVTDVVVWGNSHPMSMATYIAAKYLDLRTHVLERGLVPESWILASNQPWVDNYTRLPKLSTDLVKAISDKALAQFQDQALAKYPELPIAPRGAGRLDVGFFTGHPEALGFSTSAYATRVSQIVESFADRIEIKNWFIRPHPAHVSPIESTRTLVRRDGNLIQALRFSKRNIVLGSNVWAASTLAGQPTLLVEWQGNNDRDAMDISTFESIHTLEELDRQIHIQTPILKAKLRRHLSEDHFYLSDSLPSAESLANIIAGEPNGSYGQLGVFEITSRSLLALAKSSMLYEETVGSPNEGLRVQHSSPQEHYSNLQAEIASILNRRTWRWSAPIRHIASRIQSNFLNSTKHDGHEDSAH